MSCRLRTGPVYHASNARAVVLDHGSCKDASGSDTEAGFDAKLTAARATSPLCSSLVQTTRHSRMSGPRKYSTLHGCGFSAILSSFFFPDASNGTHFSDFAIHLWTQVGAQLDCPEEVKAESPGSVPQSGARVVRYFAPTQAFGARSCTSPRTVLALHWYLSSGTTVVQQWLSTTGTALVLHSQSTGTALVPHWYDARTILVL